MFTRSQVLFIAARPPPCILMEIENVVIADKCLDLFACSGLVLLILRKMCPIEKNARAPNTC
jgi:hypothetical protein